MKRASREGTSPLETQDSLSDKPSEIPVGVVGLGLMGTSIATCLLAAGHPVLASERNAGRCHSTKRRVFKFLAEMKREGLIKSEPERVIQRLIVGRRYSHLKESKLVIECVPENLQSKRAVIRSLERIVPPASIIGSNTSSVPVSELQKRARHPGRVLGMHWAEPAHLSRFMEIICGNRTDPLCAEFIQKLARKWGKEPSIMRKELRGFITNRCYYALLREALHLVEAGYASVADVDRSLRNDLGYWITFCGPFRYMDITGTPSSYRAVMRDLWPELSCDNKVPKKVKQIVRSGGQGVSNGRGFYRYTRTEGKRWEQLFMKFTYEIRALGHNYPEDVASRPAAD